MTTPHPHPFSRFSFVRRRESPVADETGDHRAARIGRTGRPDHLGAIAWPRDARHDPILCTCRLALLSAGWRRARARRWCLWPSQLPYPYPQQEGAHVRCAQPPVCHGVPVYRKAGTRYAAVSPVARCTIRTSTFTSTWLLCARDCVRVAVFYTPKHAKTHVVRRTDRRDEARRTSLSDDDDAGGWRS